MTPRRIAIAGGGLGGLSLAYRLRKLSERKKLPVEIRLFEASPRPGGVFRTVRENGFLLEEGPDCFISEKPAGIELAKELGLESELIGTREAFRRSFIVRGEKLHPVPEGFYLMAPSMIGPFLKSPIVSWPGKLRMMMEPFVPRKKTDEDESLASFVRRRLGVEALERVAQPMAAGIYSADPERLSLQAAMPMFWEMERKHGSIFRGMRCRASARAKGTSGPRYGLFVSFRGGMSVLTDALIRETASSVQTGTAIERIRKKTEGGWELGLSDRSTIPADILCLALPSNRAAGLLRDASAPLAGLLETIRYASLTVINLGYRREQIRHPLSGMGFVVPAVEKRALTACSFSSRKFHGRAPDENHVLLRAFFNETSDAASPAQAAERALAGWLGIQGDPLFVKTSRWEKSMPQYSVGHLEKAVKIEEEVRKFPGLYLAGNGQSGVGIPDVIARSNRIADQIVTEFGGHLT